MPDQLTVLLTEAQASLFRKPLVHDDGGFGRDEFSKSDVWSTAEALILTGRFRTSDPGIADRARSYLLSQQNSDGGWGADKDNSDTTGTALALLALSSASGVDMIRTAAADGIRWLAEYQNPDGGWPLLPKSGKQKLSTMFTTAHAYEAVATWFLRGIGASGEVNEVLTLATHYIATCKDPDTGWGLTVGSPATIRHTGYAILASLSENLSGSPYAVPLSGTERRRLISWIMGRQHTDGSWGDGIAGDTESTSAALRALLRLGVDPTSRHVRAALGNLLRTRLRYRSDDGDTLTGWSAGSTSRIALWASFYAISAIADCRDEFEEKSEKNSFVRLPRWRKYTAAVAILALLILIVLLALGAAANRSVASAVAGAAAVTGIISIFPVLADFRKYLSRRS
jgi:prenyltransferase beta subunit